MTGKIENLAERRRAREGDASQSGFVQRLDQFRLWRDGIATAIGEYQTWLEQQGYTEGAEDLRVYELMESLRADKLVIALAGEFSRGKTELLNAIFFSDVKQRLLPSGVGRTTMCPTELCWNDKDGACLKLLPIETRKTALSIAEYRRTPIHWTTLHILRQNAVSEIRDLFQEVTRTKRVSRHEAEELGLAEYLNLSGALPDPNGMVEIPVWRHAIISYPHPLLKQGLVILDTPGLNTLGSEPELTLSMLPSAHAVLFLLAADTGVTRSDLDIWQHHVAPGPSSARSNHRIVLNKIDTLWDELKDPAAIERSVQRQIADSAAALDVATTDIFPVSAQKGLLGRIKGDETLVERSGLPDLERKLAEEIIPAKHDFIRRRVVQEISGRIESSRELLAAKFDQVENQHAEFKALGGKNLDSIRALTDDMRAEKQRYDQEVETFQSTRRILAEQAKRLLGHMSLDSFDRLIKKTRRDMRDSWTTHGLKNGMTTFFAGAVERMEAVGTQAEEIKGIVDHLYARLETEFGLKGLRPGSLSLIAHVAEIRRLERQAEDFRNSPLTVMTEQEFVIRKFFIALVSQARTVFTDCNAQVRAWFAQVLASISTHIESHRVSIERKLEDLRRFHEDLDKLGERLAELETEKRQLAQQLKIVTDLLNRVHQPMR